MSKRSVITGGGGFVGQWLAKSLIHRGDEIWLAGLGPQPAAPAILTSSEWRAVRWAECDVRDDESIRRLFSVARPDFVAHLAGTSFVPEAERTPIAAYEINMLGGIRVTAAAAAIRSEGACDPVVLVVGSGTQYGAHPAESMPIVESSPQLPESVYGATKAAQEVAALQVGRASGLRVVATRSFNHSGRGQRVSFLIPSLVTRVLRGKPGSPLMIGNDVIRDFLHVDDVVRAYIALADAATCCEVFNVCSGVGVGVRSLAEEVLRRSGRAGQVACDPELARAGEPPVLVGSPTKLTEATGWSPRHTTGDIIDDLLAEYA